MTTAAKESYRLTCQDAEDDFVKEIQWVAGDVYRLIYQAEELAKVIRATWLPNEAAGYSWAGSRAHDAIEILEKLSREKELLKRIEDLKLAVYQMLPTDRWVGMDTEDPRTERAEREQPI